MYLTEQQIQDRAELFFELIAELTEELYDVSDDHEPTEEDMYITSILMDHFIETLKVPSLNESIHWAVTGIDPNQDLYDELIDAILDESIGSAVASAVHGVSGVVANIGKKLAQRKAASLKQKASAAKQKATAAAGAAKKASKQTGIVGAIKSGFYKAKAQKLAQKSEKATTKASIAATNRDAASNKAKAVQSRKSRLAGKIDTGIQNIKSKAKTAVMGGASKIGSIAGRLA
jgi:hypothetical protein